MILKKKLIGHAYVQSHVVLPLYNTHMPGTNCQTSKITFPDLYQDYPVQIRIKRDYRTIDLHDGTIKNGVECNKNDEKKLIYLLPWVSDMLFQRDFSVKRRNCCWRASLSTRPRSNLESTFFWLLTTQNVNYSIINDVRLDCLWIQIDECSIRTNVWMK